MAKPKVTSEELMQLDVRKSLRAAMRELGGADAFGVCVARLIKPDPADDPSTPQVKATLAKTLLDLMGTYGVSAGSGGLADDPELLANYIAQQDALHNAAASPATEGDDGGQ